MKTGKFWKVTVLLVLTAVISLAAMGVTYAAGTTSLCAFGWAYSNDDGSTAQPSGYSAGIDPDDNGLDPQAAQVPGASTLRAAGDFASTVLTYTSESITFSLENAYPGYTPTVFFSLSNQWSTPGYVQQINVTNPNSAVLDVSLVGLTLDQVIEAGQQAVGALTVEVGSIPSGASGSDYTLSLDIVVAQWSVDGQTLSIDNSGLANGRVGLEYYQVLTASNGNTEYTWALTSGSLPAGLSLDPVTGAISGVPTLTGRYSFTITLTDAAGDSVTARLSITVSTTSTGGGGGTVVTDSPVETVEIPGGTTAELPPEGETAEISPSVTETTAPAATSTASVAAPGTPAASTVPAEVEPPAETLTITPAQSPEIATVIRVDGFINWPLLISVLVVIVVIIFWLFWLFFRRRKQKKDEQESLPGTPG